MLGAVYAPALELLYYGGAGLGSWKRNGEGAPDGSSSRPPLPGHALRVAESRSHPSAELEAFLATLPVAERVRAGSSLKFCWVAEGRADCYPRFGPTMEWDVAAGDCIFRYSGGRRRSAARRWSTISPSCRTPGFVIGLEDRRAWRPRAARAWCSGSPGSPGSGKSTIARRVVAELERRRACAVEYLDGDAIREIFPATGFTRPERDAHIRRVGWVASRLERHGVTVVASLVSPYVESRRVRPRSLCRRFVEIWISTPVRGVRPAGCEGALCPGPGGRDPQLHRARRPVRAAPRAEAGDRYHRRDGRGGGAAGAGYLGASGDRSNVTVPGDEAPWIISISWNTRACTSLREAYASFKSLCMLWSIGKDSTVLLWLARKAFFGHVPVPAGAHRHLLQDPGDDPLPRPARGGVEPQRSSTVRTRRRCGRSAPFPMERWTGSPAAACSRPRR